MNREFTDAVSAIKKIFPFEKSITAGVVHGMYSVVCELKKHFPDFHGRRLLDIGCGAMLKTGVLQKMGFNCSAVDDLCDPWHQEGDNRKIIHKFARDIGIEFHQQDIGDYTIPFEPESFDVVASLAVIEHLHESPRGLLNTMGSFARCGGLILVTMPNSVNLRKRLSVLRGRTNHVPVDQFYHCSGTWRGHVREYTLAETKYICKETGFEVLADSTFEAIAQDKLNFPLLTIYQVLGNLVPSFRSGLMVVSRKPENWKPAGYDPEVYGKTS